ncbi:MAG TPA: hypothetical protein DCZ12_12895, partial [Gammaproteobacteria bacterium]|nr:hypothetical protein [Gammaproteobacteria bacterium]
MKILEPKNLAKIGLISMAAFFAGCSSSDDDDDGGNTTVSEGTAAYVKQKSELKGNFAEDVTLEAGVTYKITGEVNFEDGTTL